MTDIDLPDIDDRPPSIARLARRALRPAAAQAAPAAPVAPAVPVADDAAPLTDAVPLVDAVPLAETAPVVDAAPLVEAVALGDVPVADHVVVGDVPSAAEVAPVANAVPGRSAVGDRSRLVTAALSGLVALALVFAAISSVVWWRAGHGGSSSEAKARDAVLLQVHLDLATLNTLDYRAVDAGLARWSAVTTGSLHQGIADASASTKSVITKAKMVTKAVVLAAAVTALNLQKGTATVIASIQVTKTPDTGSAVIDRNRVSATMTLVHGIWRASDLQGVPVQLS